MKNILLQRRRPLSERKLEPPRRLRKLTLRRPNQARSRLPLLTHPSEVTKPTTLLPPRTNMLTFLDSKVVMTTSPLKEEEEEAAEVAVVVPEVVPEVELLLVVTDPNKEVAEANKT